MTKFKPTRLHKILYELGLHKHCVKCGALLQPHGWEDQLDCPNRYRKDHKNV